MHDGDNGHDAEATRLVCDREVAIVSSNQQAILRSEMNSLRAKVNESWSTGFFV